MNRHPPSPPEHHPRGWFRPGHLALLVWLLSLGVTAMLWRQAEQDAELELRTHFEAQVSDIQTRLANQLEVHALTLRSFAGLFNASDQVTREDFRHFYQSLGLDRLGLPAGDAVLSAAGDRHSRHRGAVHRQQGRRVPALPARGEPLRAVVPAR